MSKLPKKSKKKSQLKPWEKKYKEFMEFDINTPINYSLPQPPMDFNTLTEKEEEYFKICFYTLHRSLNRAKWLVYQYRISNNSKSNNSKQSK